MNPDRFDRFFHVETRNITGGVTVRGNLVVDTPPVWRKWKGQTWTKFLAWTGGKPTQIEERPWIGVT